MDARWGLMLRRCVSGNPPYMRHSSVRLDSGDSLARARTKSASVSAHAHRTPCRIPGVPLNAPPRLSPRSLWFVALTRSACQRHMVGQREGRNGRDAIFCVRNRSQIGRNKMRPSRDWRKSQVCASLMGWQRGRETYRGRLGGTPRPTVCHRCALLVGRRKRERLRRINRACADSGQGVRRR